jgi:protein TonB
MKYLKIIILLYVITFGFTLIGQAKTINKFEFKTNFQDTINTEDTSICVIYVSFIVEIDGSITNISVDSLQCDNSKRHIRSLKKEAIRVVKSMPKFKPQKIDGELVRAKFTMPIRFKE